MLYNCIDIVNVQSNVPWRIDAKSNQKCWKKWQICSEMLKKYQIYSEMLKKISNLFRNAEKSVKSIQKCWKKVTNLFRNSEKSGKSIQKCWKKWQIKHQAHLFELGENIVHPFLLVRREAVAAEERIALHVIPDVDQQAFDCGEPEQYVNG